MLREKAAADLESVQNLFAGTRKTRESLGVVEELLAFWRLEDADDELEELEEALILADFGPRTSLKIVDRIRERVKAGQLKTGSDIRVGCVPPPLSASLALALTRAGRLQQAITELLTPRSGSCELQLGSSAPSVVLVCGVNGGGKTTTIGKLAHSLVSSGASVRVVPGDTFRAAAGEQLSAWAARAGASFHVAQDGARPHAVLYAACDDALSGRAPVDVLLCDTSGRLHTDAGLMAELAKAKATVAKRAGAGAPHETLLVLDGTTGGNMLAQAREFNSAIGLTGLVVTKLDGAARGGAVVAVVDELGLPIKFVGVGERIGDLQPFDANAFASALFPVQDSEKKGI